MRIFKSQFTLGLFLGLILFCFSAHADSVQKWDEAANAYKNGKFSQAISLYTELADSEELKNESNLYFNLGNSYYRNGQKGLAILNLERAIALNPWHIDARYNLSTVKSKLEYSIEDKRGFFIRFNGLVLQWVHKGDFFLLGFIALFVMLVSGIFWIKKGSENSSFLSFPRLEMTVLVIIFFTLGFSKLLYERNFKEAIIVGDGVEVRYGPSLDNQSLMKLGSGLKVFIVDEREIWSRVVTWNGETGWVKNSEMGKVRI